MARKNPHPKRKFIGIIQILFGIPLFLFFGALILHGIIKSDNLLADFIKTGIYCTSFLLGGFFSFKGIINLKTTKKFNTLYNFLIDKRIFFASDCMRTMHISYKTLINNLKTMHKWGYFSDIKVENKALMLITLDYNELVIIPDTGKKFKQDDKFHITYENASIKDVEKPFTGNTDFDTSMNTALSIISQIKFLGDSIEDEQLTKDIQDIVNCCTEIFDNIRENPNKLKQVRQLISYYLPTTLKLVKNYDELSKKQIKGDNIQNTIKEIENVMQSIIKTLHVTLDDLYKDKAIDITSDIDVMQKLMQKDDFFNQN